MSNSLPNLECQIIYNHSSIHVDQLQFWRGVDSSHTSNVTSLLLFTLQIIAQRVESEEELSYVALTLNP